MQVRQFRSLFSYCAIAILTSSTASAATVNWQGEDWDNNYNSPGLQVNGLGHLEVTPADAGVAGAAHINTSGTFPRH